MTTQPSAAKLLPCPFCLADVDFCRDEDHECHRIVCKNCGSFDADADHHNTSMLSQFERNKNQA